jgi:hypothetical protein
MANGGNSRESTMRIGPSILITVYALLLLHAIRSMADVPSVFLLDRAHLAEMRGKVLERPQEFDALLKAIRSHYEEQPCGLV